LKKLFSITIANYKSQIANGIIGDLRLVIVSIGDLRLVIDE